MRRLIGESGGSRVRVFGSVALGTDTDDKVMLDHASHDLDDQLVIPSLVSRIDRERG